MRKRFLSVFTIIALCIVMIIGCSSSVNKANEQQASKPDSQVKQPSAEPGKSEIASANEKSQPTQSVTNLVNVKFGAVSGTAVDWAMYAAIDKGFMKESGLNVEFLITGGVDKSIQQLLAKSVPFAESTFETFIRGINNGADVKMVVGNILPFPYSIMAQKDIRSWSDLKGKKISVAALKDPSFYYMDKVLQTNGLKKEDWTPVTAGSTTARYSALKSGGVAAAVLTQPFDFQAEKEGFVKLGDLTELAPNYGFTAIGTTQKNIDENPETVKKFVTGFSKGLNWVADPKNKSEALQILKAHIKVDEETLEQTYDLYVNKIKAFANNGELPDKYVNGVMDVIINTGDMKERRPVTDYVNKNFLPSK